MKIFQRFSSIQKSVERYFLFLSKKGYRIRSAGFTNSGIHPWDIIYESSQCLIHIYEERSEICLTLAPLSTINVAGQINPQDQIALQSLIYYLSSGKRFVGLFGSDFYRDKKKQFEALADLLKEHIDQVPQYFSNYEFQRYKNDLLSAQKEYNNVLVQKYVRRN